MPGVIVISSQVSCISGLLCQRRLSDSAYFLELSPNDIIFTVMVQRGKHVILYLAVCGGAINMYYKWLAPFCLFLCAAPVTHKEGCFFMPLCVAGA